jgi:hypothetical protein
VDQAHAPACRGAPSRSRALARDPVRHQDPDRNPHLEWDPQAPAEPCPGRRMIPGRVTAGRHPHRTRVSCRRISPRSPLALCVMGLGYAVRAQPAQPRGRPGVVTRNRLHHHQSRRRVGKARPRTPNPRRHSDGLGPSSSTGTGGGAGPLKRRGD